jgi:hypothetical protein
MFPRGCFGCLAIGTKTGNFDYLMRRLKAAIIAKAGKSRR